MKKAMLCISILAMIFSLSACDDIKMVQNSFQKEKTRNTEQLGDQPMDVFKKGDLKMEYGEYNTYMYFSNFLAARYHYISVFYFQGVRNEPEFHLVEGEEYLKEGFTPEEFDFIRHVMKIANGGTHFPEVDKPVKTLAPLILKTMEIYNEAAAYGQAETYKKDHYEGAKEIHSRLFPLIESSKAPLSEYKRAIDELSSKKMEEEIRTMKERGYIIRYNMLKLFSLRDQIMHEIINQNLVQEEMMKLDLSNIRPAYEEFLATLSDFEKMIGNRKVIDAELFTDPTISEDLSEFVNDSKEFAKQIQEMIRRIDENEPFTEKDYGRTNVDGSFLKIDWASINMVQSYSKVIS